MSSMIPQSKNKVWPIGTIHLPGTHLNLSSASHSAVNNNNYTYNYYTEWQQLQLLQLLQQSTSREHT